MCNQPFASTYTSVREVLTRTQFDTLCLYLKGVDMIGFAICHEPAVGRPRLGSYMHSSAPAETQVLNRIYLDPADVEALGAGERH